MKKILGVILISLIVTTFISFSSGMSIAKEKTYLLKMSTQLNESHPMVEGFKEWAKRVKEKTNGRLVIEVYPSAQLGSDEDVIEQALVGVNVAVLTDGGRMANYVKGIGIIGMPYIADNYDEVRAITESPTFQSFFEELEKENDIKVLSFNWYDGARHFLTNKPVRTPQDLKGLRIRTPGAPVWSKSVESLGATPVAMSWPDTYNAVQIKAIDGCEAQHTASYGLRLYEVLKYINKTRHFQLANGIIVGTKWFNTLPSDLQTVLVNECKAVGRENAALVAKVTDDYERKMVEHGMQVIEPDIKAFKLAAESAYKVLGYTELRNKIYSEIGKK